MEALFQIGKEIGEIRARIDKLEGEGQCDCKSPRSGKDCRCKSRRRGELKESELTQHQRRVLTFLRRNHKKIFETLNQVMASEALAVEPAVGEKLFLMSFKLISSEKQAQVTDEYRGDCCLCCPGGIWCCDISQCSTCPC